MSFAMINAYPFESEEIHLLKRYTYPQILDECSICRCECGNTCVSCFDSKTNDCYLILLSCGHWYHIHCIALWFGTRAVCPNDALSITDEAKPVTRCQAETMISEVKHSAARLIQAVAERYFLLKYGNNSAFAKKYIVDHFQIKL